MVHIPTLVKIGNNGIMEFSTKYKDLLVKKTIYYRAFE